jgi:formylmethanofuran dehydrogenase subunit E
MIHKLCDRCGEMESVDFMVRLDDDYYCTECDEEMEKEIEDDYKQLDV